MYTVGLINKYKCVKTYSYKDLKTAEFELKTWKNNFLDNNVVENSITIIERDKGQIISGIRHIFELPYGEEYIMFLCKNK